MVKPDAVLDATTLIGLERIGQLHLIPELLDRAFVTTAVTDEFGDRLPWMTACDAADQSLLRALEVSVDAGEASAIALAVEKSCRIILDDRKARIVARKMGLEITGTVGLLIKAKEKELIELIAPVLDALEKNGFHLSVDLRKEALRICEEAE